MVEQIRILQAEIKAAVTSIEDIFHHLDEMGFQATGTDQDIIVGYHLHVLYGLFENLFEQIAELFGNHIGDKAQWHAQLLRRMTLNVETIRPNVISQETHSHLNELRAFRHLFRNAYLLEFDPDRMNIVLRHANQLKSNYKSDLERFLNFLDQLAQSEE